MVLSEKWVVSDDAIAEQIRRLQREGGMVRSMSPVRSPSPRSPRSASPRSPKNLGRGNWRITDEQLREQIEELQRNRLASPHCRVEAPESFLEPLDRRKTIANASPIKPALLRRGDTIPCLATGRRNVGALSDYIKIYVSIPSCQTMLCLSVPFWLPIAPMDVVGAGESVQFGAGATLSSAGRALMTPRGHPSFGPTSSLHPFGRPEDPPLKASVQGLIEETTAIRVRDQELRIGPRRIDARQQHGGAGASRTLQSMNIDHGAQLNLTIHAREGFDHAEVMRHLSSQAKVNRTVEREDEPRAWVMPLWHHSHRPMLFGTHSNNNRLDPSVHRHNFGCLRDVGIIDPCDSIRKKVH